MNDVKQFYDRVFGNRDGKFNFKDLPNSAVLVVALVVDTVALFAEIRVYQVGYALTESVVLASGFVAVSILPFLLGQIAFLYNRANAVQQTIAVMMVGMGLLVSAYYGLADYVVRTNSVLNMGDSSLPLDVSLLYAVAVSCTALLVLGGLLYVFYDDSIANTRKSNRLQARARDARQEIELKRLMLVDMKSLREAESALRNQFPQDYDSLQEQIDGAIKNPTFGRG